MQYNDITLYPHKSKIIKLKFLWINSLFRFLAITEKRLTQNDFAVAKLEYILLSLQNQSTQEPHEYLHQPQLEELARRIMKHPEQEWDFAAEAENMNISLKHFIRIFQNIHKHPPRRFVLRQRLFKARELLIKNSSMPIKMVAYECGFNNEFYFSRLFKKHMNSAPENFRKKHAQLKNGII